jgi:FKBP-type peptidyl-prolyl cis-trans isomerase
MKDIIAFTLLLSAFIVFPCCNQHESFKGYTFTTSGLHYKIITLGDGLSKPTPGNYLQLSITYKTINDSVFLDTYSYNETGMVILPFNKASFNGSFEEGVGKMKVGDIYSFIVNADSLFEKFFYRPLPLFLKHGGYVKMEVFLHNILDEKRYREELNKIETSNEQRAENEKNKIQLFLDTCHSNYISIDSDIYYLRIKQGVGDPVKHGDEVYIHYKGSFLNGIQFESTYNRSQPLQFTFGQEEQVLKGLEKALIFMNEGAKAKFIIPSQLAFGKKGSSTGIVPPFTTVIYEVELVNLIK